MNYLRSHAKRNQTKTYDDIPNSPARLYKVYVCIFLANGIPSIAISISIAITIIITWVILFGNCPFAPFLAPFHA